MAERSLMSRAREMLAKRAAGSALMILPLAAAVPAQGDSTFVVGSNLISNVISGGAMGHINSEVTPNGQGVDLTGDTLTGSAPGSFLTAQMAANGNYGAGTVLYYWSGGFMPTSTVNSSDNFELLTSVAPIIAPNDASGTVSWIMYANISDASGNTLVDQYATSSDPSNTYIQAFAGGGAPASWSAILELQWTFPTVEANDLINAVYPNDALDVNPEIEMAISSSPGTSVQTDSTPLPAAVGSAGSLLGVLGLGAIWRKSRGRASV